MAIVPLIKLKPGMCYSTIKVRVQSMWDNIHVYTGEFQSLDFIFIDEEATTFHGTVWRYLAREFRPRFQEGKVYEITNMKLNESTRYHPVHGDWKIVLLPNTIISEPLEIETVIPRFKFQFADYNTIVSRQENYDLFSGNINFYSILHSLSFFCKIEAVAYLNEYIMESINTKEEIYKSSDTVDKGSSSVDDSNMLYPEEFLNSLKFPGLPNHELKLKIGVPVMLLRNIDQSNGLCNGTRLIITQLGKRFVQAEVVSQPNVGTRVFIPRIVVTPLDSSWPFTLRRRQYPLSVCFAMTINKKPRAIP